MAKKKHKKKPDAFREFMDTEVRTGPGCQTCRLYPPGSPIANDIKAWLEARRAGEDVPTKNALWSRYLRDKCGYPLGRMALNGHIDRCLGGEEG